MNRGWVDISLKPLAERKVSSEQVIGRLRAKLQQVGGIQTFLFAAQDLRGGGRQGGSQDQYAMIAPDVTELREWALKLEDRMKEIPGLTDVASDQDRAGPQVNVVIDRDAATRLGGQHGGDRQRAEQCLFATAIVDDLHAAQPVQGGAGDRSGTAGRSVVA